MKNNVYVYKVYIKCMYTLHFIGSKILAKTIKYGQSIQKCVLISSVWLVLFMESVVSLFE